MPAKPAKNPSPKTREASYFPTYEALSTRFMMEGQKSKDDIKDLKVDVREIKTEIKGLYKRVDQLDKRIDKVETSIRTWGF